MSQPVKRLGYVLGVRGITVRSYSVSTGICPRERGGGKRPGREIDHSPPSSAEVNTEWS